MDKPTTQQQQSLRENPGAAVDTGDKEQVDPALVKQQVRELNNNPRTDDYQMP